MSLKAQPCVRCRKERPASDSWPDGSSSDLCGACRCFGNAANNTFGLLCSATKEVEMGFREARLLDGFFEGWLCPHVHPTPQEAERCPDRDSLLEPKRWVESPPPDEP
jgi:hypothetical protein